MIDAFHIDQCEVVAFVKLYQFFRLSNMNSVCYDMKVFPLQWQWVTSCLVAPVEIASMKICSYRFCLPISLGACVFVL